MQYIKSENKDHTLMNSQKERFLYFYDFYVERGQNIATTIEVLDYLTTHSDEYNTISHLSPAFTNSLINNFWAQAIVQLDAFYYEPNDLSFAKYFSYTSANWNLIFTGEFYDTIYYGQREEKRRIKFNKTQILRAFDECKKLIVNHVDLLNKLSLFRDNVFAHYGDISKKPITESISIEDLKKALILTETIINKIGVFYNRSIISLKPMNADDIDTICGILDEYKTQKGWIF